MSNDKSERRIRNNRIRRQKEIRRNFLLAIMTFCLIMILSVAAGSFLSKAKNEGSENLHKYYKCITVSHDDTLWSIAREYMDAGYYDSTEDYIKEVKQMNNLKNDVITYGAYLIVPYYADVQTE